MALAAWRHFILGRLRHGAAAEHVVNEQQHRRRPHRQGHGERQQIGQRLADDAGERAGREQDEGELAALTDDEPEPPRGVALQPPPPARRIKHRALTTISTTTMASSVNGSAEQHREVDRHADGDEEQPEQEPLERRDVGLDLMAVFRIGEKRAGDEGPERRRQPGSLHDQGDADHGEQRARGHGLAHAGRGDEAIKPGEKETPDDHDAEDGADGQDRRAEIHGRALGAAGDEQRHQRDQGDGREVLEQQNGEGEPAVPRGQLALLLQQLQGKRRRRQR